MSYICVFLHTDIIIMCVCRLLPITPENGYNQGWRGVRIGEPMWAELVKFVSPGENSQRAMLPNNVHINSRKGALMTKRIGPESHA